MDEELFIDLMYERYRDMLGQNSSPTCAPHLSEEVDVNFANHITDCDKADSSLMFSNANFGYISFREELWEKPKRENYHVSNYLSHLKEDELPMSKKQYDVILHTVKNIRQHGEQLEILLKVKHADNDYLFDFLNADSKLYTFFQTIKNFDEQTFWNLFLGRDKEEVECPADPNTKNDEVGALQLLGTLYDDEEEDVVDSNQIAGGVDLQSALPDEILIPSKSSPEAQRPAEIDETAVESDETQEVLEYKTPVSVSTEVNNIEPAK